MFELSKLELFNSELFRKSPLPEARMKKNTSFFLLVTSLLGVKKSTQREREREKVAAVGHSFVQLNSSISFDFYPKSQHFKFSELKVFSLFARF